MTRTIPLVEYLVLDGDTPHLVARACDGCGARFLDRRNGCGRCGGTSFSPQVLANEGRIRSFCIVQRAAPGVPVPFVSTVVDLDDGAVVKANLVGVEPEPKTIELGTRVRLVTYVAGTDDEGTEAVAFGYQPA